MASKKIKFPYLILPSSRNPCLPAGCTRPLLHVGVYYPPTKKKLRFLALVDSGADLCIAPADMGTALGIKIREGVPRSFNGVFGPPVQGFAHDVVLDVGGNGVEVRMVFFPSGANHLIVGQQGFFDSFKIFFDRSREIFEVEPAVSLPAFEFHPKVKSDTT